MKGTLFKKYGCRDPETGRQLGRSCPRLRRANGGWRSDHGTWSYRVDLPRYPDSKRRLVSRGGFPTQGEAREELERIEALLAVADKGDKGDEGGLQKVADLIGNAITTGTPLPNPVDVKNRYRRSADLNPDITVQDWMTRWLASRKTIRPTTRQGYEAYIKVHIVPAIGTIRLDKLTVTHLDDMFTAIDNTNNDIRKARESDDPDIRRAAQRKRITGPATQQLVREVLRAALNDAIRRGLITHNPAKHLELASGKRPKALLWTDERVSRWRETGLRPSPVMVWTPAQTGRFLDHTQTDPLYPIYHLIAYRGLRCGESVGLHWDDIDFTHATLTIRWQVIQIGYATQLGRPKSDAGDRVISLDTNTLTVLRIARTRQHAARLAAGRDWPDTGLTFTHPDGQPIHPEHLTNRFHTLLDDAALPPISLHGLRHGAATLALAAGADLKAVQELLDHSTITLTADTCTHILPDLASEIAENTARLIPRARTPTTTRRPSPSTGPHQPRPGPTRAGLAPTPPTNPQKHPRRAHPPEPHAPPSPRPSSWVRWSTAGPLAQLAEQPAFNRRVSRPAAVANLDRHRLDLHRSKKRPSNASASGRVCAQCVLIVSSPAKRSPVAALRSGRTRPAERGGLAAIHQMSLIGMAGQHCCVGDHKPKSPEI
ncbi:integrase family protein [Parafrankia sp. EAN1pec]|uniref:site-specific integrase n=1 Tax=Parafrankia sp. (strain EAN1pec) TaxID=298653 RepID=UPI0000543666|nr:integrase family protein [Frankia sp. EAN1pec]